MNFKLLENNRYVSDGNLDTVVIPETKINDLTNSLQKEVKLY